MQLGLVDTCDAQGAISGGDLSKREGWMEGKSGEEICLFVRDEQTGRFLFNATAMQTLGFDPAQMQERGYLLKEPPEAREAVSANKRDQVA